MLGATWVFAEALGFKAEADRARALARTTSGRLQGELHQIAALYERIADGKDLIILHQFPPAFTQAAADQTFLCRLAGRIGSGAVASL